jgi:hypothetical protein
LRLPRSVKNLAIVVGVVLLSVPFGEARTLGKSKSGRARPANTAVSRNSRHNTAARSLHKGKGKSNSRKSVKTPKRTRGQQGIENERAREIQQALIRANYLDGVPSGTWDSRSRQAMARYQADNGWQTKVVPDSRALIKLGLGPKHANVINPEVVSASVPDSARQLQPGGSTVP